jgi:hypothetical protein
MTGCTQGIFMCANINHIRESVQNIDDHQQQATNCRTAQCTIAELTTIDVGWNVTITACSFNNTSSPKAEK